MTERIDVREISKSGRFEAVWRGEVIVRSSRLPLLDAARVLMDKGITGRLEMWGGNPAKLWMIARDIEKAAGLTVAEPRAVGIHFRRYRSYGGGSPRTADQR